jgi:serine/threonine-protein phosphatase 2A regulatory subunit A
MVDFNVLEFFKEEIASDTAAVRIEAINNLNLIASALGPQKTREELIPYLVLAIDDEKFKNDEEFLCKVASGLGEMPNYMNQNNMEILIPPLESLAAQEETVIRTTAGDSLRTIVEQKPELASKFLVPCLHRLATKSDFFTARVSACSLFPTAYRFCTDEEQRVNLRKAFVTICCDETPMVRRAAATSLTEFAKECDKDNFLKDLAQAYKQLSQEDTQDSIRVSCVHTTIELAKKCSPSENEQHTVSVIKEASEDRSWRVRLTVAKHFCDLCGAFGTEITSSHLLDCHKRLLQDQEFEVRKEALQAVETVIPNMLNTDQLIELVNPLLPQLQVDTSQQVRAALAKVLGPLCKALGREKTQKFLMPVISDLMKDEFHDVRLNIVSHAGTICEVIGVDGIFNNLLHTIQSLIMDNHWRIRETVVKEVPKLAKLFGVEMFQSKLESLFISSLRDSVYWVRKTAITHLKELCTTFGSQWTVDHLLPKIVEQYSQAAGYANRMTTLNALPMVCSELNAEQLGRFVVPLLLKAAKDSVPNVRYCACYKLQELFETHKEIIKIKEIEPLLNELMGDSDCDVQYVAQLALRKCRA